MKLIAPLLASLAIGCGSTAKVAKLAPYGQTPGAMAALVAFLQGRAPAPGHLRVVVAGVARTGC